MIGERWRGPLLGVLFVLSCAFQATTAAGANELAVDIASLDADEAGDVVAVVSVVDGSGRPVLGLTGGNFVARIEGSPASISQVTPAVSSDIGVAVVLTVDVSGSMEGSPLAEARAAARGFVGGLAPIDTVALVTFGDDAVPVHNFTTDRDAVFAALEGLQAGGNTALYQATSASVYVAASSEMQRKAIILLSDGIEFGNRSAVSREESLTHAATLGVPFFAIGLGTDVDRAYLETLAQGTGGRFLETPTPQGLEELYGAIGDFLRSQYVVTLSAGSVDRSKPLTLEIEVTQGEASGLARQTLPVLEATPVTPEPPVVTTLGLVPGAEIDAPVSVSFQVTGESPLKTLRVTVDGSLLAEFTAPPYEVTLDPANHVAGGHVLRVEATDTTGGQGATELNFVAAAPPGGGPSSGLLVLGLVLLLLATVGMVGLVAVLRRRPAAQAVATRVRPWSPRLYAEQESQQVPATEFPTLSDEALGRLVVVSGPQQGAALEVGVRPRRIGSASHCDLALSNEDGTISPEESRVWVSEGRLMYHKLARLTAFASDNPAAGWFVLQDGDEVAVGSHRLVFELLSGEDEDAVTEALARLEQAEEKQDGHEVGQSILRTTVPAREEDQPGPEPAPTEGVSADPDVA